MRRRSVGTIRTGAGFDPCGGVLAEQKRIVAKVEELLADVEQLKKVVK